MAYIDEHVGVRDGNGLRWGVESICDQLSELGAKIAPATYYEHRTRKPTQRQMRDEELKPRIAAVHASNYGVYGARKVWLTLNRERPADEAPIARCTVRTAPRTLRAHRPPWRVARGCSAIPTTNLGQREGRRRTGGNRTFGVEARSSAPRRLRHPTRSRLASAALQRCPPG